MTVLSESSLLIPPDLWRARRYRPREKPPRSPGHHVMAIVKRLAIAAGKLEEGDWPGFDGESYPLLPLIGEVWEDSRAATMGPELTWQPGELERDGIFGSPDGAIEMGDCLADWEAKATTARLKSIADCYIYVKQGLSYAAMSGLYRVVYDVLWLLGDYSRPYQPLATRSIVEYSTEETEKWWSIMLAEAPNVTPE